MNLTQAQVREYFEYDTKTGNLIRRFSRGKAKAGTYSTAKDKDGYLVIGINGKLYRTHRVVWLYFHGKWPENDCDHINRVRDDNRIENLRDVTKSQNKQNQLKTRQNKTGFKGVFLHKQSGKYVACIESNGERFYLGLHKTADDAAEAYSIAAKKLHVFNPVTEENR